MSSRFASFCTVLIFGLTVDCLPAHAQGPGGSAGLAARLAALEARVAALETVDIRDVPGTYQLQMLGIELSGGFPARVNPSVASLAITLNADGTGTLEQRTGQCALTQGSPWVAGCDPDVTVSGPFTWAFANGTLTIGVGSDEPLSFLLTPSGVFVFGTSSEFLPGNSWNNIGVLVKTRNQ